MDRDNQLAAVDSLRDWSKWLIGIDLAAATGCVVILQGGVQGPAALLMVLAIAAFVLSVMAAVLLVRVLSEMVEHLPLVESDGEWRSINDYRIVGGIRVRTLARAQMLLLTLGAVFFLAWVAI